MCAVTLSTNVLAVSLSGIFDQRPTMSSKRLNGTQSQMLEIRRLPNNSSLGQTMEDQFYAALSNIKENTPLPAWIHSDRYYLPFSYETLPQEALEEGSLTIQHIKGVTTGLSADMSCFEYSSDRNSTNSVSFEALITVNSVQKTTEFAMITSHKLPDCRRIDGQTRPLSGDRTGQSYDSNQNSSYALEIFRIMDPIDGVNDDGFCSAQLVAGWLRLDDDIVVRDSKVSDKLSSTIIGCHTSLAASSFELAVSLEGRVLQSRATGGITDEAKQLIGSDVAKELLRRTDDLFVTTGAGTVLGVDWHNDTLASDWPNSLLKLITTSNRFVDPNLPVPIAEEVIPLVQNLYRYIFSIILGLNPHIFAQSQQPKTIPLEIIISETRLFVDSLMFNVSAVLLILQLAVATLYYSNRPQCFLPRLPTNIASIIAFVSESRALDDFWYDGGGVAWMKGNKGSELTYGYGRFVGKDGKTYVGIERQQYVVPLNSRTPKMRRCWIRKRSDKEA